MPSVVCLEWRDVEDLDVPCCKALCWKFVRLCSFVFVCVRLCVKSRCCGGGKLAVLCVKSMRSEAVELSEFADSN